EYATFASTASRNSPSTPSKVTNVGDELTELTEDVRRARPFRPGASVFVAHDWSAVWRALEPPRSPISVFWSGWSLGMACSQPGWSDESGPRPRAGNRGRVPLVFDIQME